MKQLYVRLTILILALGCSETDQSPVVPERTIPRIEMTMTATYSQQPLSPAVKIQLVATNSGPPVTLAYQCAEHFGVEILDGNQRVILRYPTSCEANQHNFVIEQDGTVERNFEFGIDLPYGSYTARGGLLEHEHEYPWVYRLFEVTR
ncbi:MAG: hypothetical protein ACYSTZ_08395 [Planctomycetota bacterium]